MIVLGNITTQNSDSLEVQNTNVYLLDIRNFTWVDSFNPTPTIDNPTIDKTPSNVNDNSSDSNKFTESYEAYHQITLLKVIIGTISGILGTFILMTIGFLIWNRKKVKTDLKIPGSSSTNHCYHQHYLNSPNTVVPLLNHHT